MRSAIYEHLNAENRLAYLRARFTDGLKAISSSPAKAALATLYCGAETVGEAYQRYGQTFER